MLLNLITLETAETPRKVYLWSDAVTLRQSLETLNKRLDSLETTLQRIQKSQATPTGSVDIGTIFIRIKAGLIYTQGVKYMPGSAAEWIK